jgi:cell shape-determining protein MreC
MRGDKNKMSTAKERYYSLIEDFEIGVLQEIIDYVTELEQELAKLKESQTQKSIIKLCERVDKAEQQVEELKKENVRLSNLIGDSRE